MNLGKGGNRVSSKEIINIASLATNYNNDNKNNNCLTVDEIREVTLNSLKIFCFMQKDF